MATPDSETLTFEAGEVLIARGSAGGGAYVLLAGSACIEDETATPPLIVGPGAQVGADDLMAGQPQRATVVAIERVSARRLSRRQLAVGSSPVGFPAVGSGAAVCLFDQTSPYRITIAAGSAQLARQLDITRLTRIDLPFSVGRKPGRTERAPRTPLDLVLVDVRPFNLSRRHFAIDMSPAGPVVHDPGSQLGTTVNGVRIGTGQPTNVAPLSAGANEVVAGIGTSPFRFAIAVTTG